MKLPDNAVGPTDIQQYRDCPRRFEFGMRRHTDAGEHPEAQGPSTAYGSAVHEAIAFAEAEAATDDQAVQRAFDLYAKWLDPEDLERLRRDLDTYRARDYIGVRTVAVEQELRAPLFEHDGQTIYLRTRIDRLYQRLDNQSVFIHVDYKSSRWPKSAQEVHEDRQLWLTNLIVHEVYPECVTLRQVYDQLNFGQLRTDKNDAQRALIREWATKQIIAILHDNELEAKKNEWCPWCPILESCSVVRALTHYAAAEIAVLAPEHKEGRRTVVDLDPALYDEYVDQLENVGLARKILDRYDESVRGVLRKMPAHQRERYGYDVSNRSRTSWPPEAMRAAHEVLGDEFYELASLSKAALERRGSPAASVVLDMAVREDGAPVVSKRKTS
jgi:PD-(D/E)XK nuclease superfamily